MQENTKTATIPRKDDEISLKELILKMQQWFHYLLSKWYIIVVFGLLGAAIGYWYAASKKPVYTATTTFVLETGESNGLNQYAGLASMAGVDVGAGGGGLFTGDNIIELYKSRTMIERTLLSPMEGYGNKELLIDRYIDFNKLRENWKKPELRNFNFTLDNKYSTDKDQLLHDSIMGAVVKDINKNYLSIAKPDKKLSIIKVDVKARDEVFAKAFNEQLVARVNDFYVTTKTKKSQENVAIMQGKVDSVRGVMMGAIYRAARVLDATPNLNPTHQTQRIAPVQSAQANSEVNKAILPDLVRNLELSKIALSKETPLIQVIDGPILPLERSHSSKLFSVIVGGLIGGLIIILVLFARIILQNILKLPTTGSIIS